MKTESLGIWLGSASKDSLKDTVSRASTSLLGARIQQETLENLGSDVLRMCGLKASFLYNEE
jgi:hypothetical protein